MSWRPLADRVLVELEPLEEVRASGLVVPGDAAATKIRRATVKAVGAKVVDVSVGDRIVMSGYSGTVLDGDKNARLIREGDILVVLT